MKLIESLSWSFAGFFVVVTGVETMPKVIEASSYGFMPFIYTLSIFVTAMLFFFKGSILGHGNVAE